jgi:DNA (cytosine-5)-methyltransferase 1
LIFKNIKQVESKEEIKDFLKKINIVERILDEYFKTINFDISSVSFDLSNAVVQMKKMGFINGNDDLDKLKSIVGNKYEKLTHLLNAYTNLINLEKNDDAESLLNKFSNEYRETMLRKSINDSNKLTLIDLFCGAGGLSLGFYQEGFRIELANDIEKVCTETYKFNHPDVPPEKIICGDVKEVVDNIFKHIENKKVDIIIGGPPCQSFSMANRQRIIDDPRNMLYKHFVRAVEKVKPKLFLMENVKGMLPVAEQVKEDFENIGYKVHYHVFNSKDYSVPQNRERLIFVGSAIDGVSPNDIIMDMIKHKSNTFVLKDAIEHIRPLEALTVKNATELDSEVSGKIVDYNPYVNTTNEYIDKINMGKKNYVVFNHKARYNNDRDIEIFARMHQGDKSDSDRIADIMPYKDRNHIFKDKYFKLIEDSLCKTITAHMKFDCNMYIHPTQARGLTPREAARVQSYPDDYYFCGAFTKTYMQVGNSVPPLMARAFAQVIKEYLEKNR